jgi:hypothetical protein
MEDKPETTTVGKNSFNWWAWILWPFIIVLLYLLSHGPISRAVGAHSRHERFLDAIYAPWMLVYAMTPLHRPLGLYMHFWMPEYFDKNGEAPWF